MTYEFYKGSTKIKRIYYGSQQINQIYKGSTLVWKLHPYAPNTVMYESSTAGDSSTLNLEAGLYRVILVGGGGGGCGLGTWTGSSIEAAHGSAAGGGSGAGLDCIINISKGSYNVTVGSGGNGKADSGVRDSLKKASNGTASKFGSLSANGGTGGSGKGGDSNSATAGSGGSKPSITYNYTTIYLQTAGNSGEKTTSKDTSVSGGSSIYSSKGKGGNAKSGYGNYTGTASNGGAGYVKVIYIGQP